MRKDGITLVFLKQCKVAIIDSLDAERVLAHKWRFSNGYATRQIGNSRGNRRGTILLHRWLLDVPEGMDTDHINGDKLDNRRSNLRPCSRGQNNANRGAQGNNTSGYKGVVKTPEASRWTARIGANGTYRYLGCFRTPEEAAHAYDAAAQEIHGEFARLNFPHE